MVTDTVDIDIPTTVENIRSYYQHLGISGIFHIKIKKNTNAVIFYLKEKKNMEQFMALFKAMNEKKIKEKQNAGIEVRSYI